MNKISGIENIIFDLGGVVINLDYNITLEKFKRLNPDKFEELYDYWESTGLFYQLEIGRISGEEFIQRISESYPIPPDKLEVIDEWTGMLLDFPEEREELLRHLKTKYRTFLLSNTNKIHLDYYFNKLQGWYGVSDMSSFFHKEYYSCYLHMRKPDQEIFEYVIKDNDLDPSLTLFIDDGLQNIEAAGKLGLQTIHLTGPETIVDILS